MSWIWLRVLLASLTLMLTIEAPVPVEEPVRTAQEEAALVERMEATQDIRECISLGAELELDMIDLDRFDVTAEEMDALYYEMLGTRELPWYMELNWSYIQARDETVRYLKPAYLDPAKYQRSRYEQAAQEALAEAVLPGMSELQIALSLHEYLSTHCAYDDTLTRFTEYDVLVRGSAVCQGYSEAYMDLLGRAGIESIIVTSEQMNHCWNQVKLDGQWYNVDLTWNDPSPNLEGMVGHSFFLISDERIGSEEYGYYGWSSPNACTDTTYETEQFWTGSTSPVVYADADTCYLIRMEEKGYRILSRKESTGEERSLGWMDFKYPEAFATGRRRLLVYVSGLSKVGDGLYYTDVNGLRRLDLATGEVTTVYEHDISESRQVLVGSFLEGGTLYLTTMDKKQEFYSTQIPFDAE